MQVRVLRFKDRSAVSRAFARIVDCPEVGSCVIEPDEVRIRFVAPGRVANALIERIYAEGGLVWSRRHRLRPLEASCGVMRVLPACDDRESVEETA